MNFGSFLHKLNLRSTRLFPSFKTIVVVSLICLLSLTAFSLIKKSFAVETETVEQIVKNYHAGVESKASAEWYTDQLTKYSLVRGVDMGVGNKFLSDKGQIVPGGLVGSTNQLIGQLYNPPASGIQYIAQTWDNFLGKPAYAQGVGFVGLQPILPIWTEFRNIAYLLSSLFFVIIGMMIILRVKISPQATITIQNAIPQLVTTLILITFSYAIAGLMIDLSYVIQGMAAITLFPDNNTPFRNLLGAIPFIGQFFPSFNNLVEPNFQTTLTTLVMPTLSTAMLGMIAGFTLNGIMGPLILLGGGGVSAAVSAVAVIVILIVVIIGLIFWLFKFLIGLLKCYAMVIFKIVIAPLEIGMGAFPNSKINFSSWFFDLISNLFVFPISFAFLLISNKIILSIVGQSNLFGEFLKMITGGTLTTGNPQLWVPSLLGGTSGTSGNIIAAGAIGLSTLMLLSKLPDMIPQFIFMIKPSPWGQAIGEGLNTSFGKPAQLGGRMLLESGGQLAQKRKRAGGNAFWQIAGTAADTLEAGGQIKGVH